MTTRVWTTQRPTGESVLLRDALAAAVVPDLSPLRASFGALNELTASIADTFTAVAERIEAEYKRATEGFRVAYKALPRSVRRALSQGKARRMSADRASKAWPGTDALTPDHPARVIYKRLLSRAGVTSASLDRALERCSDADERAHRNADTATVEVQAVAVEVEPVETDAPERIEHHPGAPQLLLAVTSSRNAPADSHARTVNSAQTMQGRPL